MLELTCDVTELKHNVHQIDQRVRDVEQGVVNGLDEVRVAMVRKRDVQLVAAHFTTTRRISNKTTANK